MPSLRKLIARRRTWRDWPSFLWGEYHRMLRKRRAWPLPGRGRATVVRPGRLGVALRARLGTSDFLVIDDLLVRGMGAGAQREGEYDAAMAAAERGAGGAERVRLVLDLGANIGVAAALLAERFPAATVLAVEPDAGNFDLLRQNAAPFGDRVRCVRACVAGARRRVTLDRTAFEGEPWAFAMADAPGAGAEGEGGGSGGGAGDESIDAVTIDDLLAGAGIEASATIDLVKCDIEGAEREVFESCAPWIGRARVLVVELHAPYREGAFVEHLESAGGGSGAAWTRRVLKEDSAIQVVLIEPAGGPGAGRA